MPYVPILCPVNYARLYIKGVTIGIEVFGLPADFDPKKNTIVKVSAGELRDKLAEHYENEGREDRVIIRIPRGSYVPIFTFNPVVIALDLDSQAINEISFVRKIMDERGFSRSFILPDAILKQLLNRYPHHPKVLTWAAMLRAAEAECTTTATPRKCLELADSFISAVREQNNAPWECSLTDAWINATLHWNWGKAEALFDIANESSSGEASACQPWHAWFLASQLRLSEAVSIMRAAASHSHYDRIKFRTDLALFQIIAGKLDEADENLTLLYHSVREAEHSSHLHIIYSHAALLSVAQGNFKKAADLLNNVPTDLHRHSFTLGLQSLFFGLSGNRQKAREGYERLKAQEPRPRALQIGLAASGAGSDDIAIEWLTKAAIEERDPYMILIAVLPLSRHLLGHSGLRSLVTEKMKLRFLAD